MKSFSPTLVRAIALAALASAVLAARQSQTVQPPTFRSGVDVTTLDVTVVDDDGRPLPDLKPDEIRVQIDGKSRKVVRADWIPLTSPVATAPLEPLPEGYSSNQTIGRGRLIVMAFDRPNIRFDAAAGLRPSVNAFINQLQPADRVAVIGLGQGGISTQFTADRELVKRTIAGISGAMRPTSDMSQYNIGLAEANEIAGFNAAPSGPGNSPSLDRLFQRECIGTWGATSEMLSTCREQLIANSFVMMTSVRSEAQETLLALRALLDALKAVNAPKTVVIVSEGFLMEGDQAAVVEIGSLAAAAQTSLYVLRIDSQSLDMSVSKGSFSVAADRQLRADGVGLLASVAKGEVFDLLGNGASAFERVQREIGGYYLVGLESEPTDKDGKSHSINVRVSRRGAIVRARRELASAAAAGNDSKSARERVADALSSPLPVADLPLRVATFALRDPKDSRIQLIVHADVGSSYTSAQPVTVGYVITDVKGQVVVNQTGSGRLPPAISGAPSPLVFSGGAALDPGEYTLKLAIAEGEHVGSVEHAVHAALIDAGDFKLSELMIGGPADARLLLAPTVGYDVRFGTVQGYIEAYGSNAGRLTLRYELAPDLNAPALFSAVVPGRSEGGDRQVFSYAMPVQSLSPGEYYLRATLSSDTTVVRKVARAFRVTPAPPLAAGGAAAALRAVPLDVRDDMFARPFRRDSTSRADTLQRFRDTLASGASRAFDDGAAALVAGDDARAEQSFRAALEAGLAGADNTAPLAFLAATYAASGRDLEAIGIWQAALVDGAGFPQIYEWLGEAFMRLRSTDEARTILEEAAGKWPGDTRFAKPLAILYARAGRGSEALALLERYLDQRTDDNDALYLGIEWIYQLHNAGAVLRSRDEDVKAARVWADAYLSAKGPEADNVNTWMLSLEAASDPARPAGR